MQIGSLAELEQAIHEFQGLEKAAEGSAEAKRRDDLAAAITAYYAEHSEEIEPGKPCKSVVDRLTRGQRRKTRSR